MAKELDSCYFCQLCISISLHKISKSSLWIAMIFSRKTKEQLLKFWNVKYLIHASNDMQYIETFVLTQLLCLYSVYLWTDFIQFLVTPMLLDVHPVWVHFSFGFEEGGNKTKAQYNIKETCFFSSFLLSLIYHVLMSVSSDWNNSVQVFRKSDKVNNWILIWEQREHKLLFTISRH